MGEEKNGITITGYEQELKRAIGFKTLLLFAFGYIAPTTVFTYYGLISMSTHGMLAFSYLVATLAVSFTAFSYAKMVRIYPIAGSSYSYATKSIHPYVGFMTGWVILLDYVLLPIVCYVLIGLYCELLIPGAPPQIWIVIAGILFIIIGSTGIDILTKLNNILVIILIVFVVALFIFFCRWISGGGGAGTFFDGAAFINTVELSKIGIGTIFSGASVLILCFLGIDAATTVAEEVIEPEKNVGKAIITVTLGVGAYFIIYSYVMQLAWPTGWQEFESADTGIAELVLLAAGGVMSYLFQAVYILSCFVGVLTISTSATRIMYSMGRDGVFPKKFFGYVHPKWKTPVCNIILVSVGAVITACTVDLLSISSVVNYGALIAFTMVNVSVVAHYYVREKKRGVYNTLNYLIVPVVGAIICLAVFFSLDSMALKIGTCWAIVGLIYLAVISKGFRKPITITMDFSEKT